MQSNKASVASLNLVLARSGGEPLYRQIESQILERIAAGELTPGVVLPPIRDIATELNLSYVTVQQAFAALARAGAVQQLRGKGTVVLDAGVRGAVGIYCRYSVFEVDSPAFCRYAVSMALRQLKQHGMSHRIYLGDEGEKDGRAVDDIVSDLRAGRLGGLLVIECTSYLRPAIDAARELGVPVVALHKTAPGLADLWVDMDADDFVVRSIEYLAGQGRSRIAVTYTINPTSTPDHDAIERLIARAGLEGCVVSITGHPCTRPGGYAAMAALAERELDGLVVLDEFMASGIEQYLVEQAVEVPDSLAVVTQWSPNSGVHFVLPFVRYESDTDECVVEAMDLLRATMAGDAVDKTQRLLRMRRIDDLNSQPKSIRFIQKETSRER